MEKSLAVLDTELFDTAFIADANGEYENILFSISRSNHGDEWPTITDE